MDGAARGERQRAGQQELSRWYVGLGLLLLQGRLHDYGAVGSVLSRSSSVSMNYVSHGGWSGLETQAVDSLSPRLKGFRLDRSDKSLGPSRASLDDDVLNRDVFER